MADEKTYGFSRDDATALVQGISHGEAVFPEIRPRGGGSRRKMGVLVDALPADPAIYPTGTGSAASDQLTTSEDLSDYADDYTILIEGAGTDGAVLQTTISSATASIATLADDIVTAVTSAAVTVLAVADAWPVKRAANGRLVQILQDGEPITHAVVNRYRTHVLTAGTLIEYEMMDGEYRLSTGDCDSSEWTWPEVSS